jgi:hypothetical protein
MNLEHIVNIYKSRSVAALPAATAYPYMLRCNREAPVLETWFSFFGLATEAQQVVALRLWKLGAGGLAAQEEAFLMVNEKAQAGTMTMLGLMMSRAATSSRATGAKSKPTPRAWRSGERGSGGRHRGIGPPAAKRSETLNKVERIALPPLPDEGDAYAVAVTPRHPHRKRDRQPGDLQTKFLRDGRVAAHGEPRTFIPEVLHHAIGGREVLAVDEAPAHEGLAPLRSPLLVHRTHPNSRRAEKTTVYVSARIVVRQR